MHTKKTLIILVSLFIIFTGAQTVFAQVVKPDPYGFEKTAETAKLSTGGTVQGITGNVIGAILTMVGVLFLVLMIYGGIIWMMARGNEQQTQKALQTITAAVIGLIIVLGSYAFTNFIFTSVEGGSGSCVPSDEDPYPLTCDCGSILNPTTCNSDPLNCCIWQ